MKKLTLSGFLIFLTTALSLSVSAAEQSGDELLQSLNSKKSLVMSQLNKLTTESSFKDRFEVYSKSMDLKNEYKSLCEHNRLLFPKYATQATVEEACLEYLKMVRLTTSMER